MKAHGIGGLLIAVIISLASVSAVMADCGEGCDSGSACNVCDVNDGAGNFIEIGVVTGDVSDSEDSYGQRGLYPEDWLTSGRLFLPATDDVRRERFEVRWDDVSADNGRAWGRLALWPATLSYDGYIADSFAWNQYSDLALQSQDSTYNNLKLRFHRAELDNMSVQYETREFNRDSTALLNDYSYERLSYKYNFTLGCDKLRGSFRQVATAIDAPRTGNVGGEVDSSILKLDADLSDEWSFYGKGVYTTYNFENISDDTFEGTDYKVGLRYHPNYDWEFSVDYRAKDNPVDNTVSTHVDSLNATSAQVTYLPGCGNRIEAGYEHSTMDYRRLQMQDPTARGLLRGTALLTPAAVSAWTTRLYPEQDEVWTSFHWSITDRLSTDTRLSYTDGDVPGTDLVGVGSHSLFFDQRFKRSSNWYYDVNGNDQLAVLYSATESLNNDRDSEFDMRYLEGSWSRRTGGNGYLTLAVSSTESELDTFGVVGDYTSDDVTYLAGYTDSCPCFDFGLDLSLTDGSGVDEYEQMALGADVQLKRLGPVGLRFDWFDRNYDTYPAFDTEAFEVGLNYTISF